MTAFLLTRLMRGVTTAAEHAADITKFLLTRLMRGVTPTKKRGSERVSFLLTRLMRGVTARPHSSPRTGTISTHTPHARRDNENVHANVDIKNFYSHASCEA